MIKCQVEQKIQEQRITDEGNIEIFIVRLLLDFLLLIDS